MARAPGQSSADAPSDFLLGDWTVRPSLNRLQRNGEQVTLQNLSMQVLVYLAKRPGQVVTYDELLDTLWRGRVVGEDAVHRRIADVRRKLGDSRSDPIYIQTIPKKGYRIVAKVGRPTGTPAPSRRWGAAAAFALIAITTIAMLRFNPDAGDSGITEAIEAADQALTDFDLPAAYRHIRPLIQQGLEDPDIERIRSAVTTTVSIETSPPNAMVHYRFYGDGESDWLPLGVTPLQAELPHGTWQLRVVADGYSTTEVAAPNPSRLFNNVNEDFYTIRMAPARETPEGMVFVPGGDHLIPLFGFYTRADLGDYYIGKTEVSNREYQAFVDQGGYEDREYWQSLEEAGLPFERTMEAFVDTTGVPGPAGWVDGRYPDGGADLPVTGVSWFEASAYAAFRGMQLPSARHWARASLGIDENNHPLSIELLKHANIDSSSPRPVTDGNAVSTWGAVNLVGNVREWTTTADGDSRVSVGLGFRGPEWAYALPGMSLPRERAPDQGFRLASYSDEFEDVAFPVSGIIPQVPVMTDEQFSALAALYEYRNGTITPDMVTRVSSIREERWIREKYLIESGTLAEPLPIIVFRPLEASAALQPVIYLPPGSSYTGKFPSDDITLERFGIDFLVDKGRALVWPIIAGTHERFRPRPRLTPEEFDARWLLAKRLRRAEIGAVIDFLEYDPAFDGNRVSLMAASFGATVVAPHILATEDRLRAAVLVSSSLASLDNARFDVDVNPNAYWPRVVLPTLVLNGRYDIATHISESRSNLFEAIGTPVEHKRFVLYDSSHWPLPKHRVASDSIAWLDEYAGYVEPQRMTRRD
jgi:DNA-binding winged helix-turn-helix (wHTH) protein